MKLSDDDLDSLVRNAAKYREGLTEWLRNFRDDCPLEFAELSARLSATDDDDDVEDDKEADEGNVVYLHDDD